MQSKNVNESARSLVVGDLCSETTVPGITRN